MGYVTPLNVYYEGDRAHALDKEVPPRPSPYATWDGAAWTTPDAAAIADARAQFFIDAADRIIFEVLFDHENRVRVLEAKAAITRVQFRAALIARWKVLNP